MKVTRFDRTRDLIVVRDRVWGPHGPPTPLRLAVDTAAAETIVIPEVLDELGYSPRQGEAITVLRSAVGREQAEPRFARKYRPSKRCDVTLAALRALV